jgi:hypothetical protein
VRRARFLLAAAMASSSLAALGPSGIASAAVTPSSLCTAQAFFPALVPLPSFIQRAYQVTGGVGFYQLTPSANAKAHHALCDVEISTLRTDPKYLDNISWYVFPSHGLAVADLEAFNVHTLFSGVTIDKRAVGFPTPNYELAATDTSSGKSVTEVTFADGPTVTSGYVYGGGTLSQAIALAHWAASQLQHLRVVG